MSRTMELFKLLHATPGLSTPEVARKLGVDRRVAYNALHRAKEAGFVTSTAGSAWTKVGARRKQTRHVRCWHPALPLQEVKPELGKRVRRALTAQGLISVGKFLGIAGVELHEYAQMDCLDTPDLPRQTLTREIAAGALRRIEAVLLERVEEIRSLIKELEEP